MTFTTLKRKTPMTKVKPESGILRTAKPVSLEKPSLKAKPKARKCAHCKTSFVKQRMGQVACGPVCALEVAKKKREKDEALLAKQERAEFRHRKEAAKPLQQRLKETEKVVNEYVRIRDRHNGCISCDKPAHWDGQWHASHFKSVGSNSILRFHLWNINKACSECNLWLSGNIAEYEKRLVLKKGAEKVEWLKQQNGVKKYDPEYLDRMKKIFTKKIKRLERRMETV